MSQNRFEREIEEIVSKADLKPKVPWRFRFRRIFAKFSRPTSFLSAIFKPTRLGLAGAIALIVGLILRNSWLIIGSLIALLLAYLFSIMRSKGTFHQETGYEKSWRGRTLDEGGSGPSGGSWWKRFRKKK